MSFREKICTLEPRPVSSDSDCRYNCVGRRIMPHLKIVSANANSRRPIKYVASLEMNCQWHSLARLPSRINRKTEAIPRTWPLRNVAFNARTFVLLRPDNVSSSLYGVFVIIHPASLPALHPRPRHPPRRADFPTPSVELISETEPQICGATLSSFVPFRRGRLADGFRSRYCEQK